LKHILALLLLLILSACKTQGSPASPPPTTAPVTPSEVSPVYVSALCTLMGQPARMEIPKFRPVIVMWGWSAATSQQVQDYIGAAIAKVAFDGSDLPGRMQPDIPFDETAKVYRAVWMASVGIPAPGLHVITYSLEFGSKIFDGVDDYGPGTKNEKMTDRCEIDVK